jgi:hypothetical protein
MVGFSQLWSKGDTLEPGWGDGFVRCHRVGGLLKGGVL